MYGDKGIIIPKGTVAHGKLANTTAPARGGREASMTLSFDYLVTPDGREIPIEGKMTTKLHPVASGAKIVAQDVGIYRCRRCSWRIYGTELAWAGSCNCIAGIYSCRWCSIRRCCRFRIALIRKGNHVLIAPGDEIKVKIMSPVDLPVYKEDALKQEEVFYDGLTININDIKHEKDPFGEVNTLTLTVLISKHV